MIPKVLVGYEMIANKAHRAELAIISLLSNKCKRNNCLLKMPRNIYKSSQLYFVSTDEMLQWLTSSSCLCIVQSCIMAHNPCC